MALPGRGVRPVRELPVLLRVVPQGLDRHDDEHARSLRMALAEWRDNQAEPRPSAAILGD
jgi:hypothetical protein